MYKKGIQENLKREYMAMVEDIYLQKNGWPIQVLCVVDRNNLQMIALKINVVFILKVFYIQVWQINLCLSFSKALFKGIVFGAHHHRFALFQSAHNAFSHINNGSFPNPQHICPWLGKNPIILTLTTRYYLPLSFVLGYMYLEVCHIYHIWTQHIWTMTHDLGWMVGH